MARFLFFVVMLVLVGAPAVAQGERRVALVIGNGAYTGTGRLANTVRDAAAVADSLERLGFEVRTALDVDRRAAIAALDEFSAALAGSDIGLLFYAGHGMQIGGDNFLLPVDVDVASERALRYSAIEIGEVVADMERKARVALVVLDACRDNPFLRALALLEKEERSAVALPGLGLMQLTGRGAIIAYAAAAGEVASDGAGQHSPYTSALLEEIDEEGVEVGLMFRRVAGRVLAATQSRQRPELLVRLVDEVYLNPAPLATAAVPATLPEQPEAVEVAAAVLVPDTALPRSARAEGFFGTLPIHKPEWVDTVALPNTVGWRPAPVQMLGEITGNNSFGRAAPAPLDAEVRIRMPASSSAAWFKITVPVAGELAVRASSPPQLDLFARVWNADRQVIADWQGAPRAGGDLAGAYPLPRPGDYWVELTDGNNDAADPALFSVALAYAPSLDPLEPNDGFGAARPVPLAAEFRPSIYPRGDADWYRVWAPAPGRLTVAATGVPPQLDVAMRVWDLDGKLVRDWVSPPRAGGDTLLEADVAAPGVYLIELADASNDAASTEGFALALSFQPVGDEAEPNDRFGEAAVRDSTGEQRIAIFPRGDADWFSLSVDHPGELRVEATGLPPELDVHMRVWDANKDLVADWAGPLRPGGDVEAVVDLPRPGRYFVEVVDGNNDASSLSPFTHALALTPQPDQLEPNNSIGVAAPVSLGGEVLFNILPRGDADWFRIEAPSAGELAVSVDHGPENLDLHYRVWSLDRQLVRDWVAPYRKGGLTEGLADLPGGGSYFVEVVDGNNDERSIEHATLKTAFSPAADPLEPNDSFGSAAPVGESMRGQAFILPRGDADWFELTAPGPGAFKVLVDEVDPALDIFVRLWDAEGLASGWIGPPRPGGVTDAAFPVTAAGTFRLELVDGNSDSRSAKPFRLSVAFQ